MQQPLDTDLLNISFESCYYYATNQMKEFEDHTDGPRHRKLVEWIMHYKHTNGIIREKIVAKALGLVHNPRLHSTCNGIASYDATDTTTGNHYEIKTEQYNTVCDTRVHPRSQLTGAGLFGSTDYTTLFEHDPTIAHGMFINGKLCGVATFKLSETLGAKNRIYKYSQSNNKTVPRYIFSDWGASPNTQYKIFNHQWPEQVAVKYRTVFAQAAAAGKLTII